MESVYKQLYTMVKKCEEKYDHKSNEYLTIDIHCNSALKRYKDWISGCTDVAMEIASDALRDFMTIIFVLKDLNVISVTEACEMGRIAMDEQERIRNVRFKEKTV